MDIKAVLAILAAAGSIVSALVYLGRKLNTLDTVEAAAKEWGPTISKGFEEIRAELREIRESMTEKYETLHERVHEVEKFQAQAAISARLNGIKKPKR